MSKMDFEKRVEKLISKLREALLAAGVSAVSCWCFFS